MKQFITGLAVLCFVFGAACTSSNTVTQGTQSNSSYDSNYRQSTSSSGQNYGGNQPGAQPTGDAPITIMLLAAETGDMYPGEDYYIYAVVDNPSKTKVDYIWSVTEGDMWEVPESERGRLTTLVEEEYKTAKPATAAPADQAAEGQPAAPAGQTPAGQQPAGPLQGPAAPPADAGLPGASQAPVDTGDRDIPPSERGVLPDPMAQLPQRVKDLQAKNLTPEGLTPEEAKELDRLLREFDDQAKSDRGDKGAAMTPTRELKRYYHEFRVVAGPDETAATEEPCETAADAPADETTEMADKTTAADETPADTADGAEDTVGRDEQSAAANVGEDSVPEDAVLAEGASERSGATGGASLRSEYEAWKDGATPARKRSLGSYGGDNEEEPVTADESYEAVSFTTSEPFIQWEPIKPGKYTIYCKVAFKDDEVTAPMPLEVEVRLREAVVNVDADFADTVREDDAVYATLDAENLPAFNKGLFTVTYDPDVLSFREAELGEFFDDAGDATLYAAQPDKAEGKVLLAVDSNTEIIDLSGDGPLVYLKFKAKQDIKEQSQAQLAMAMDTSARYILDRDGENVLPIPVTRPPYRTDTTMPPALPEYEREVVPGSEAGKEQPVAGTPGAVQPAANGQPGVQTPAAGGGGAPVTPAGAAGTPAAIQQQPGGGVVSPPPGGTGNEPVQTGPSIRGGSNAEEDTAPTEEQPQDEEPPQETDQPKDPEQPKDKE